MTKIFIEDSNVVISEIAFNGIAGVESIINHTPTGIKYKNSDGAVIDISKHDIPKVIQCLQKAIGLGWCK